jgi:FkbM family methyltransferase
MERRRGFSSYGLRPALYPVVQQKLARSFSRRLQFVVMRRLLLRLARSEKLRKTIKFLRLHRLANAWLRQFPVVKTLPRSGIRYRARRLESLELAVEMFDRAELYSVSGLPADIRTFADLGCNVGYFTCWLCDRLNNRSLKGIMVDANVEAVTDAKWHVAANHLDNVHVLHGLAGTAGGSDGQAAFFLHASNVCSSATPPDETVDRKDTWTRVEVPCVNIEKSWQSFFGDAPCDLLKVDIEGSEMDFFRNEPLFLQRAGAILLEWHKWQVTLADIEALLAKHGFLLKEIFHESADLGTALFVRKP